MVRLISCIEESEDEFYRSHSQIAGFSDKRFLFRDVA